MSNTKDNSHNNGNRNKDNGAKNDGTQDDLNKKLADAKAMAAGLLGKRQKPILISDESMVEVAKKRSPKDIVLWLLAVFCLIAATLVPEYLGAYWMPANDVWVRVGMTVGLIVVAFAGLAFTHQGRAFKVLLKDAGVELYRITWPSKQETMTYTWQVIVVTIIAGILVWLLDNVFNHIVGFILG